MLETLYLGKNIIELDVVDSTNSYAVSLIDKGNVFEGTTIVAHYQGAGKGQRGNVWVSEPGKNLTFTLVLKPSCVDYREPFLISKIVSLAICKYLKSKVAEDVFIKWPNDIYIGEKKVCGILIENQFKGKKIEYSLVGIGININQTDFENLPRVTSLGLSLGKELNLKEILHEILKAIEVEYLRLQKGKTNEINEVYLKNLLFLGETRSYEVRGEKVVGKVENVLANGQLVFTTQQGESYNYDIKEIAFLF